MTSKINIACFRKALQNILVTDLTGMKDVSGLTSDAGEKQGMTAHLWHANAKVDNGLRSIKSQHASMSNYLPWAHGDCLHGRTTQSLADLSTDRAVIECPCKALVLSL